jgi:hypothetical protein
MKIGSDTQNFVGGIYRHTARRLHKLTFIFEKKIIRPQIRRITGVLGFVHRPDFKKIDNITFRKLGLL